LESRIFEGNASGSKRVWPVSAYIKYCIEQRLPVCDSWNIPIAWDIRYWCHLVVWKIESANCVPKL
jgi:hypothetical protein